MARNMHDFVHFGIGYFLIKSAKVLRKVCVNFWHDITSHTSSKYYINDW